MSGAKCLCQLCSCGRHKCPKNCAMQVSGETGSSEYRNEFIRKQVDRVKSFRPPPEEKKDEEERKPLGNSQKVDYPPHPIQKKEPRKREEYHPTYAPFDDNTSYKNAFTKKPIRLSKPKDKQKIPFELPPFDGTTLNKTDFIRWPINPAKPIKHDEKKEKKDEEEKVVSMTNYQKNFVRHQLPATIIVKPSNSLQINPAPLDDRTEHKDAFIKHRLPEKETRLTNQYEPLNCKLDAVTMYKKDFDRKEIVPPKKVIHESELSKEHKEPIENFTVTKSDYMRWPIESKIYKKNNEYNPPAGEFDGETTHKREFTRKPLRIIQSTDKPKTFKKIIGPFDDKTTYKTNYKRWQLEPFVRRNIKQEEYKSTIKLGEEEKKEGEEKDPNKLASIYQQQYIKLPYSVRVSFKPDFKPKLAIAPLDTHSEYKNSYIRKNPPPCAAGMIQAGNDHGYKFLDQDSNCHKWYSKECQA